MRAYFKDLLAAERLSQKYRGIYFYFNGNPRQNILRCQQPWPCWPVCWSHGIPDEQLAPGMTECTDRLRQLFYERAPEDRKIFVHPKSMKVINSLPDSEVGSLKKIGLWPKFESNPFEQEPGSV